MKRRRALALLGAGLATGLGGCQTGESAPTPTATDVRTTVNAGTATDTPGPTSTATPSPTPTASPTPTETSSTTQTPTETPTPTATPTPEPSLNVESRWWYDDRDGRTYVMFEGSASNPQGYAIEATIEGAGWYADDSCSDDDPDDPDWLLSPRYEGVVIESGATWEAPEPWEVAESTLDGCGFENLTVWVTNLTRATG